MGSVCAWDRSGMRLSSLQLQFGNNGPRFRAAPLSRPNAPFATPCLFAAAPPAATPRSCPPAGPCA
eukprot:212595-Chlamydomonas_euryale.AAC.1